MIQHISVWKSLSKTMGWIPLQNTKGYPIHCWLAQNKVNICICTYHMFVPSDSIALFSHPLWHFVYDQQDPSCPPRRKITSGLGGDIWAGATACLVNHHSTSQVAGKLQHYLDWWMIPCEKQAKPPGDVNASISPLQQEHYIYIYIIQT